MLTVLSVSYPFARVSEETAGGAEQILRLLDETIVAAGMNSIVFAPLGSKCRGHLVPFPAAPGDLDEAAQTNTRKQYKKRLERLFERFPIDVVHFHGVDFGEYISASPVPNVVTLHLPATEYSIDTLHNAANSHLVCVSDTQQKSFPPGCVDTVIRNGVSVDRFSPQVRRGDYVLALGRICPEKGFHLALDAASRAGFRCILAGRAYPYRSHMAYFEERIIPRLCKPHEFMGLVADERKAALLAGARCVLIPSLIPETSCLVAMEALASGTPVVAFDRGALREVIDHGNTGFLVNSVEEMASAIENIDQIDVCQCRTAVEKRFSARAMARQYLDLYRHVANKNNRKLRVMPRRSPAKLTTRILEQVDEIRALVPEWNELFSRCRHATSFQRSQWLMPWMETYRPDQPLFIEVRDNDRLVGLAPCLVYRHEHERILGFAGGGVSDYLDALIDRDFAREVLLAFGKTLKETCGSWDRASFTDLQETSTWLHHGWAEWEINKQAHSICPVIHFVKKCRQLTDVVPKRQLRNLRNARARLARESHAEMKIADKDSLESILESLFCLHDKRWKFRTSAGALADNTVRAFHRKAAPLLLADGILRLYGLHIDGRIVASLYALVENDVTYCYVQAFDPDYSFLSPGTLVLGAVMEDAIRAGAHRIDLLRGEESYKYAWGAREAWSYRCTIRLGDRDVLREEPDLQIANSSLIQAVTNLQSA